MAPPAASASRRLEEAIIEDTILRGDPTMHAELEKATWSILHTAKRSGPAWSVLSGGPMSEKEQCLYEADQFEMRAQELRAALGLMGVGDAAAAAEEEPEAERQQAQAEAAAVEEGQAAAVAEQEEGGEQQHSEKEGEGKGDEEEEGEGLLGSVRAFLPRFLGGGRGGSKGARETLRLARRYETMAACLRTQAEMDLAFWPTSGQYVRPEELSLLYLARRIILSEGEKDRHVEAHPEIDRHDDVSQELEDISKRLLRYRTLFSIRTGGRWFQTWSEDGLQVCSDARIPGARPNAFHVQCFFDGTVTEADLADSTEYLRVHEAEKRARWQGKQAVTAIASGVASGVTAPFRLFLWPFSAAAAAAAGSSSSSSSSSKPQSPRGEATAGAAGSTALATSDQGKSAAILRFSLRYLLSQVTGTLAAIFGLGGDDDDEEEDDDEGEQEQEGAAMGEELQQEQREAPDALPAKHAAVEMGIPSSEAEQRV